MHWCTAPGFTLYLGDTHNFRTCCKSSSVAQDDEEEEEEEEAEEGSEAYEDVSAALDAVHLQRLTPHQAAQVCALWSVLLMPQNL